MYEVCRGENCMKKCCASLKEHAMKMIKSEKKKN